jgi:hypothetical protein
MRERITAFSNTRLTGTGAESFVLCARLLGIMDRTEDRSSVIANNHIWLSNFNIGPDATLPVCTCRGNERKRPKVEAPQKRIIGMWKFAA